MRRAASRPAVVRKGAAPGTIYVIGNVNVDIVMGPLAPWPRPGTESILPRSEIRAGGAAGISALTLRALGAPYRMVCNIGDDMFGRWLAEAFGAAGRGWPKTPNATTVSVGLTHPGGERTFLTTEGHLSAMALDDALALLPARAEEGDLALLCGGFVVPRLIDSYEALIEALKGRGFALALDTGWPSEGWSDATRRRVAGWLAGCDHVLLNEIESCGLSGESEVEAAAHWIAARAKPGAAVVVKRGRLGATAWQDGRSHEAPAPRVHVVDTIGAGDVFNASYLHARLQGRDLAAALREGVTVASAAVSTSPRRYGPAAGGNRAAAGAR
jgi:sugar/nucleoside kinase (ribokinase family)